MLFWENNAILFYSIKWDLPMLKIYHCVSCLNCYFKKYPLGYTNKGSLILSVLNAVRLRQVLVLCSREDLSPSWKQLTSNCIDEMKPEISLGSPFPVKALILFTRHHPYDLISFPSFYYLMTSCWELDINMQTMGENKIFIS